MLWQVLRLTGVRERVWLTRLSASPMGGLHASAQHDAIGLSTAENVPLG